MAVERTGCKEGFYNACDNLHVQCSFHVPWSASLLVLVEYHYRHLSEEAGYKACKHAYPYFLFMQAWLISKNTKRRNR